MNTESRIKSPYRCEEKKGANQNTTQEGDRRRSSNFTVSQVFDIVCQTRHITTTPPMNPPFRYALVEDGLHRGAYPKDRNLPFLKSLSLVSILSLCPNAIPLNDFATENNIKLIHLKIDKVKEDSVVPLSYSKVAYILSLLIDSSLQPLYIHCLDGTIVTGLVIGCLRKLQCWSIQSCLHEYSRWSSLGTDDDFIEKFTGEVEVKDVPTWVWPTQYKKHPHIKLKQLGTVENEVVETVEPITAIKEDLRRPPTNIGNIVRDREEKKPDQDISMTVKALALETSLWNKF